MIKEGWTKGRLKEIQRYVTAFIMITVLHILPCPLPFCVLLPDVPGFLPPQYPEEHGVHLPPRQKLSDQQGHTQPLSVLQAAEVLRGRHVQGRWVPQRWRYREIRLENRVTLSLAHRDWETRQQRQKQMMSPPGVVIRVRLGTVPIIWLIPLQNESDFLFHHKTSPLWPAHRHCFHS